MNTTEISSPESSVEKNIFIGIGIFLAIGLGILFLTFADWSTENLKADITNTSTTSDDDTSSTTTSTSEEENKGVYIEKGYMLGGNTVYRNGETQISLGLSSAESIDTTQSIEVEMISGNINIQNYDQSVNNSRFILKEYLDSSSVSKVMENYGGKNWAAVYIDLHIPDYGKSQMPDGKYTLVASIHRDEKHKSQIFIPIILKNSHLSCDINNDGFENMIDIILSLKIMNGEITPSAEEKTKLDSNTNGILDLVDTMTLFKCILNPPQEEESYFENSCKKSDDPILILQCPSGTLPNIRHITISEVIDNEGNTSTEKDISYTPDPISGLLTQ